MNQVAINANRNAGHRMYFGTPLYHDVKLVNVSKQAKQVYNLMKRDGRITRYTAIKYGIANLTARITELRREGIGIGCEIKVDADGREYGSWNIATVAN
jgi:hypothetical protein